MTTNLLNNLSNVVEKGTSKEQVGNKLMAGVPCSKVGRISEEGAIEQPLSTHSAPFGIRWKPAVNMHKTPSTPSRFARLAAMVTLLLTLACGNMWGNQTDLISGVTLPDVPSTSLDMSTQTFKTPDANGWIVMQPNADIRNASVTWFTALAWNTTDVTISDVSSFTAPFTTLSNVAVTTVRKTARTKAIRFTGATDISFLVASGGSRTIYVSLYSYNGITQTLVETKSTGTNSATELLFTSLTASTNYIAYMYESTDSNGWVAEIAIKKPVAAGSTWYVKGSFDSWGDGFNFTGIGTELTATVNITTAGLYEFKINNTDGNAWYGNSGNIGCNVSGWTFTNPGSNCKFFASETGNYTFTFNTSTKALSVTYPTAQGKYYYKNTSSWGTVAVYRYVSSINNGWPGTQVVETETICGDEYYVTYADPGTTLIFNNNNNGSQTGNMAASGNAGKYVGGTGSSWSAFPTYTISFAANGGSGSMSSIGSISCGSDQAIPANSFTAPSGYQFAGWKANVAVKVGGVTQAAGTVIADGVTIQDISSNITLTAQWEEIDCPDEGTLFSMTVTSSSSVRPPRASDASTPGWLDLSEYATISGYGRAKAGNKATGSDKGGISSTAVNLDGNDAIFWVELDCPLQAGDVITATVSGNTVYLTPDQTRAAGISLSTGSNITYTIVAKDKLEGETNIYGWKGGGNAKISAFSITRSSSCTAPTALAAASTTAKGTTFTVTDGADTNDYEFYVSTSSTTPTSGSSATYTSTSKTKTITDCVAGTTYYAWVRSKCDVSSKSEWTALTGNTFTTSTVTVTHTLTNVTKTSGAATAGGSDYTAVYAAVSGYSLPTPTVTIDGNTATSGTDYTWTAGTGTLTIPANKINGNIVITLNSAAAAPSSVAIGDNWLWFAGETMTLTATPTGGNGPVTYQWYKGGKADGNAIDGATNATFSKTCAFEDAGSYYCKVTCGGTESTWGKNGDAYEVKIPRLYVKTGRNDGVKSDYGNVDFTRVDASTATASISLGSNWDYCFNIADGCGHYYGNAGTMQYNNYGPWVTNVNNQDCGLRTTNGATYVFTINYSNWTQLTTTITFPSSNQAADKVIYFDNNDRQWSNLHYRIGRGDHTQAAALTLVPGTANLYKYTTVAYNNFAGWHIANNSGWTGSNTIYRTYTNGDQYSITYATAHEGGAVTQAAVTVTPTTSRGAGSDAGINDNCTFYNYEITTGMKTQNVSITAPSNGTITVSYTDVNNAAQSFTSGNADLAHTVIITPTVSPATGYQLSGLTVNGNAHTPGNTYTVTGTTVVAATFSLIDYTVTLNTNGGTINAGNVTSYNYGTGATLPTNVTKDGFTFGGWYDNSGLTGSAVTTISTTATGNKEYWAKWTEVVAPSGVCWDPATTPADKLDNNTTTLTTLTSRFAAIDGVTSVTVDNPGTGNGQCAGSDDDSGYLKVKNATTYKIITIVTTAPTNITIGGKKYGSNTGSFYLVKSTDTETKLANCNTNAEDEATNCPAGTYYVYAKADTKSINFSKLCIELYECSTPAAPTGFTAGSITSTGATFSITDGGDAASYDIYYSTSSDAPTAGTAATTTSTSKTKAVTGLTASTTYYAWVRSVCDADHKSAWVALSGSSFTTSAAGPSGDCDMYFWFNATADATTAGVTNNEGGFFGSVPGSSANTVSGSITIDGTTYNVTQRTSNTKPSITFTVPSGKTGKLYAIVNGSSDRSVILKQGSTTIQSITWENSCAGHDFDAVSAGTYTITSSGNMGWCMLAVKVCDALSPCTTPVIPSLPDRNACPGDNVAAWDATQTASLETGETATYSWKKKGSDVELATTASFDVSDDAKESEAGTYVVTVTVSADGKASKSASKEVTLTVTPATETPSITASKAKVYATDEVTLTATCGSTGVTWNWYLCANADGTGAGSSLATSATYTIASAPAAGTYYYKAVATGDGTHSCGTAEYVYTLVVSAANSCDKEFWFAKEADRPTGAAAATHISGCPSGSSSASYTASIDGTNYTLTGSTGQKTGNVTIVVPADNTGTLYVVVQGSSSRTITLSKGGTQIGQETPENSTWGVFTFDNLDAGTYTLVSSGNISWAMMALKLCPTVACSDDTPTAAATNATVCAGGSITITATGYETGATFQWQKQNASTSVWENIDGATSDTYTVATAVAEHAGSYHVVATKNCARTSNTVTIAVPSEPVFNSFSTTRSVMATLALSISDVEASDAVSYKWYKSADATWDAGDAEIGDSKNLIKAYAGEATGSPSYYVFCRAANSCGITTSTAIAVNVTTYVEEDCATRGNEGDAAFSFENSGAGQGSYESTACWTMNSNSKILVYYPPTGKYFKTAKVTIASSSENKASYNWSTNGGTSYTAVRLDISTTLTERTIDLSAHGNVDAFQIGRNFNSTGESSGTLYVSKICFEYTEACTATTVTPSESSVNYEMGVGSFTEPTFTVKHGGTAFDPQPTLTYTSSNEDIASVGDDGTVTFNGNAGTVTITASYAGGTISATEYCASSGSYTITVSCSDGAPKIFPASSVDLSGCNSEVVLNAKQSNGTAFDPLGDYQWYRDGVAISGATSASYTARQAGVYTVERTGTGGCTNVSSNSATVTSETTEPEVERLVPFQYYHVDKTYTNYMKMRHLFAVKNSGKLDGKSFKLYVSRNGGDPTDVTSSNALAIWPNADGRVDSVMVDLNKLNGKYSKGDELVYTCKAIDCSGNISETYKSTIQMHVIDTDTATLALICSGASGDGTRKTSDLVVGGDFLTGYNKADLCVQTGSTAFDKTQEWGLYTELKEEYIVTPVNGYAPFYKLNYEPFDILFLTDYPKASKSDAAKDILDDMAALCDYRPLFSFKTHMVAKSPSKWAAKGFTTSATENKADGRLNLNIVCYAHPMFDAIKTGDDVYNDTENTSAPLIYTMLSGTGHEGNKGMQGFEIAAAENFVTIGLTHYNAAIEKVGTNATWTPGSEDRMLVTVAERQTNIEARMILFSLNAGAHSKLTDKGEQVVLACLSYLLDDDPLHVADCSFTFDNGASNEHDAAWYAEHCPGCTGTAGDGKWSTAANWAPDYRLLPGEFTSVRIAAPVTVDMEHAHVLDARIKEGGHITIPAGKALEMKGTLRRLDGSEISPTENEDIFLASNASGNGSLIFNNDKGDSKATVAMYTTALADIENMSATTSTWQYIGTPHNDVARATYNYYDSWLYQYSGSGWEVIPNGGPLVPFRGYCVTHPQANHTFVMYGTLTATTNVDINVPAGYTVIANSWVAPIDITTLTNDDMEGIDDKTIYFFNTGSDAKGENGTGTAPGTYVAVPKNAASYVGNWQIPSMQGFYLSSSSAGTLHLDYGRHVRPAGERTTIVNNPMYAPRRAKAVDTEEPLVLKMFARGRRYHDKLVVLERANFTTGYDSGWDGEAWGGSDLSPQVYVIGGGRYDAVSAIPDFEGTVVAFRAGEDEEYTIDFIYDAENEPLYLFDTENNSYTQIVTGGAYHFTTSDKAAHSRFILTRHAPQIATGCENLDGGEGAKAKKLLIEDKMFIMVNGLLYDATGKVVK